MSRYELRLKAREMRAKGESLNVIVKTLGVCKSTCSSWTRDIILSVEQLQKLKQKEIKGAELGRTRGALIQKQNRYKREENSKKEAIKIIKSIKKRDLFMVGIALYWAEGAKGRRVIHFVNSDPKMINLMITWLKWLFKIKRNEFRARVGINQIHVNRNKKVIKYWSKTTGIPVKQFTKTSFKKVKNKKIYDNFNEHYGTLDISVLKPARFYYKIVGLIEGFKVLAG